MNYTELHLHTWDSLLDGLNNSKEYMARASELGMSHLAITDHGTLTGHREFQREAKAAGITPILGCEMYISATDRFDRRAVSKRDDNTQAYNHVVVLAESSKGLRNLNKLSEMAWTEGFYSKPRIDMELLEEYNDGLIVLSGCLNGLISKAIEHGNADEADFRTSEFKRIFDERFFIEVQGHNPLTINEGLMYYAQKHGVRAVVTSDCHHAREEDLWLEEAMLILSTKPKALDNPDLKKAEAMDIIDRLNYLWPERKMTFQNFGLFLHSAEQHIEALKAHGIGQEVVDNTMVVANMIGDYPYYENLDLLPVVTDEPNKVLREKIIAGAKARGTYGIPEYDQRREEEFKVLTDKNFATYFLIEEDIVSWAKEKGIWVGPGRGSGVGFLINYELGITQIDPIKKNLLAFRFINPERNDYPDIDTDVEIARRGEVKEYALKKYKHVASIATFGTFQGKAAVRDAARVLAVPLGDVNRCLKGADWPNQLDFFEQWEQTPNGKVFAHGYPEAMKLAKFLYRRKRTQGMHAGGLVFSKFPIANHAPMQTAENKDDKAKDRVPLVALDMNEIAEIGFIKYDFLGLEAGTIIRRTLENIKNRTGDDIDLYNIDFDEKPIFEILSQGYTKAIFQCEAGPYTNLLVTMGGVKNMDELVASNALVRPGAMKSTAGQQFIDRKEGREAVSYPHPDMEWFTKETYGVVIYQEQVMLTMTELAGMSMAEADKVRKIIGKKREVAEFDVFKTRFIEGATKKVSKTVAERLWHDFEAHAGYSFNKSHAEAYSLISYWTAWLKHHYPVEFMAAVLEQENDKDSRLEYLIETKRLGIPVLLPHVNASGVHFEIQQKDNEPVLRFGLADIKYISDKGANILMSHRPFKDYAQLLELMGTKYSGVSTRMVGSLNKVGAAAFEDNPRTGDERDNFYEYLSIPSFPTRNLPPAVKARLRPLEWFTPDETFVSAAMVRSIKTGPGWARLDLVDETGTAGVFTSPSAPIETGRMYVFLIGNNRVVKAVPVEDYEGDLGFSVFKHIGNLGLQEGQYMVISWQPRKTRAGKQMADVTFTDESGNLITALVWPSMFGLAYNDCQEGDSPFVTFQELEKGYAINSINGKS